mgnify:CR=1 FL=1
MKIFAHDLVCVSGLLPLMFIALNLFMIPKYADTLYTGRVLQGYFVISIALLFLMLFLQRNLPSDGDQHQPECEIAAGEPAAFHAAAALRKPESCH